MKNPTLAPLSLEDESVLALPLRPGYATHSKRVFLRANHFPLLLNPDVKTYKYDADIYPEVKISRMKRRIFELLLTRGNMPELSTPPTSNYENQVITNQQLDFGGADSKTFLIIYYNAGEKKPSAGTERLNSYQVKLTFNGPLRTDKLIEYIQAPPTNDDLGFEEEKEILQGLQSLLTINANRNTDLLSAGRSSKFYPKNDGCFDLGGGVIAIKGYYASVHTATSRLLVNANVCTSAFYDPINLWTLMTAHGKTDRRSLEVFVKGLRVEIRYLKGDDGEPLTKERSIFGFSHRPDQPVEHGTANDISFGVQNKDGQHQILTIAEWFLGQYKHAAKLDVPIVNLGNKERPVWTPAELCYVLPGQAYRKKLGPEQTNEMTKCGAVGPANNARRIVGMVPKILGVTPAPGNLEAYGLKLVPKMVTVPGHNLNAPKVSLCGGTGQLSPVDVRNGRWNMAGKRFSVPANIKSWSYLILENQSSPHNDPIKKIDKNILEEFRTTIQSCGISGIKNAAPVNGGFKAILGPRQNEKTNDEILQKIFKGIAENDTKILLVFLPSDDPYIYSRVKRWGDLEFGVHTSCCVVSNLKLGTLNSGPHRVQFFANLAMKINLKAGGANQVLSGNTAGSLLTQATMFVGIDVTHSSTSSLIGAPSIAGVVANIDNRFAQWPASISLQETAKKEMVQGLKTMMQQRLRAYSRHNQGKLPDNVIIYRDGVSDSQYMAVLREELPQMQDACRELYPADKPQPRMAIFIVVKSHQTRLYPINDRDADRLGNPNNGTLVDRAVTMHRGWDFYLQAHTCIKGTAIPAHYVVIHNQFKDFENVNVLHTMVSRVGPAVSDTRSWRSTCSNLQFSADP